LLDKLRPLLLGSRGTAGTALVWTAVSAGNVVAGNLEASNRQSRRQATSVEPWTPAIPVVGTGHGVLRLTGWPSPASGDRWRAPARLLAALRAHAGPARRLRRRPDRTL